MAPDPLQPCRRGPGRPPSDEPRVAPLHIRVSVTVYDSLCRLSLRKQQSLNATVRQAIDAFLVGK